jgi:MFS transporter, PAT family, beta-lactamase induction signal transducer AmpG
VSIPDSSAAPQTVPPRNPWFWVPSLYFAQGIPYVVVMTVSVVMYKRLGISNTDIALYTSWLYLPWVIKPLWSPVVEMFKTKRHWIVVLQLILGVALAGVAFTLPMSAFFRLTIGIFWLMAFASATHDIAADGFYMLALPQHQQAAFVGVRSTFYRFAMITGQGLLVMFAGTLEQYGFFSVEAGNIPMAWSVTFGVLSALFLAFFLYHMWMIPRPPDDRPSPPRPPAGVPASGAERSRLQEFVDIFVLFFKKDRIGATLAFLLLYRFAEAQLVKLVSPFLLDGRDKGGLGLSTTEVGFVYGTVGVVALTIGGLLGGYVVSRRGLRFWLWPMVLIIHLPDLAFVFLSQTQPSNFWIINAAVATEQFGYGFGFTAYMLYMILVAEGEQKTAHYAICTGFMALGMMLPGLFSGALQEAIGYQHFFLWVILSTIPGFIVASLVRIPEGFGRKAESD